MVDGFSCRLFPVLRLASSQYRDKSLTECTLGKQSSEQIWNTKGHIKGVSQCICPKRSGNEKLSDQSRDTGSQGPKRNSRGGFKEAHGKSVAIPKSCSDSQKPLQPPRPTDIWTDTIAGFADNILRQLG